MCQSWNGSCYAGVQGARHEIAGEDSVTVYRSSDWAERAFCRHCGSNLYFRFIPSDHTSFLAGLFELPTDFAVTQEIFHDSKPAWCELANDSEKKTGAEIIAEAEAAGFTFD